MAKNSKDFLVSTADVAFYVDGVLAFTGTTALNTSISVSMEDQEVTGGKGGKIQYKYKFGRKLSSTIEMADWKLDYMQLIQVLQLHKVLEMYVRLQNA